MSNFSRFRLPFSTLGTCKGYSWSPPRTSVRQRTPLRPLQLTIMTTSNIMEVKTIIVFASFLKTLLSLITSSSTYLSIPGSCHSSGRLGADQNLEILPKTPQQHPYLIRLYKKVHLALKTLYLNSTSSRRKLKGEIYLILLSANGKCTFYRNLLERYILSIIR